MALLTLDRSLPMELNTLKKKLSTFVTEGGYLKNVSDVVLYELLVSWEEWPGSHKEFYKAIGYSHTKLAGLLGRAKKLKREGHFGEDDFKEIGVEGGLIDSKSKKSSCQSIELEWDKNKVIRFPEVNQLLEFMKKAG